MENNSLFAQIRSARIPLSKAFKAELKKELAERHKKKYMGAYDKFSWSRNLFRFTLGFGILSLIVTRVFFPGGSDNASLELFIEKASAESFGRQENVYHALISIESENDYGDLGFIINETTEKEVWISPNGDLREQSEWSHLSGPDENGKFDETGGGSLDLLALDQWGNTIHYTELRQIGTELREIRGETIEQAIYNVPEANRLSSEDLISFENQIACINTEEDENLKGYGLFRFRGNDPDAFEASARWQAKEAKYALMQGLQMAAGGLVTSDEIIELLADVQDEPDINYELKEMEGRLQHKVQVNIADFSIASAQSKESLESLQTEESLVTLYFDDETTQLSQMTTETFYEGTLRSRSTLTVESWEYLDHQSNAWLFEPTEEFVAVSITDRFERDIGQFEAGCYDHEYMPLPKDEADEWIRKGLDLTEAYQLNPDLWNHPLTVAVSYYRLPGEDEVQGAAMETPNPENDIMSGGEMITE